MVKASSAFSCQKSDLVLFLLVVTGAKRGCLVRGHFALVARLGGLARIGLTVVL